MTEQQMQNKKNIPVIDLEKLPEFEDRNQPAINQWLALVIMLAHIVIGLFSIYFIGLLSGIPIFYTFKKLGMRLQTYHVFFHFGGFALIVLGSWLYAGSKLFLFEGRKKQEKIGQSIMLAGSLVFFGLQLYTHLILRFL